MQSERWVSGEVFILCSNLYFKSSISFGHCILRWIVNIVISTALDDAHETPQIACHPRPCVDTRRLQCGREGGYPGGVGGCGGDRAGRAGIFWSLVQVSAMDAANPSSERSAPSGVQPEVGRPRSLWSLFWCLGGPIFISFQNGGGIAQPPAGTRDLPAVGAPALSGTSRQQGRTGNASGRGGPVAELWTEFDCPEHLGPSKAARQLRIIIRQGRKQLERSG